MLPVQELVSRIPFDPKTSFAAPFTRPAKGDNFTVTCLFDHGAHLG
jgi:hypothetical protein